MRSFIDFIEEDSIKKIDLIYMNIEGSEYKLLNRVSKRAILRTLITQISFTILSMVPNH